MQGKRWIEQETPVKYNSHAGTYNVAQSIRAAKVKKKKKKSSFIFMYFLSEEKKHPFAKRYDSFPSSKDALELAAVKLESLGPWMLTLAEPLQLICILRVNKSVSINLSIARIRMFQILSEKHSVSIFKKAQWAAVNF